MQVAAARAGRAGRAAIAAMLVALASLSTAAAQDFPNRAIRVIVPFSPGGAVDGPMRVVAQELGKRLGQAVAVENRPGAGATIGSEVVAKADNQWVQGLKDIFPRLGAFPLSGDQDSALLAVLPPGLYSVSLTGIEDGAGQGLIEVYDADVAAGGQ